MEFDHGVGEEIAVVPQIAVDTDAGMCGTRASVMNNGIDLLFAIERSGNLYLQRKRVSDANGRGGADMERSNYSNNTRA